MDQTYMGRSEGILRNTTQDRDWIKNDLNNDDKIA